MFSIEIIAIPDLVNLSNLSKFETGNTMYRTRDRQTDFRTLVFVLSVGLKGK
jgi:hypothetical protein